MLHQWIVTALGHSFGNETEEQFEIHVPDYQFSRSIIDHRVANWLCHFESVVSTFTSVPVLISSPRKEGMKLFIDLKENLQFSLVDLEVLFSQFSFRQPLRREHFD